MRRMAILIAPFLLAGCTAALPPQLALVTQAADGVAYVFTGKSGTDHIVSTALRRDCAVIRMVQGEAICKPRPEDTDEGQAAIQIYGGQPGAALDAPTTGDQTVQLASVMPAAAAPVAARPAGAEETVSTAPDWPTPLLPRTAEFGLVEKTSPVKPAAARASAAESRKASYYVVVGEFEDFTHALDEAGLQTLGPAAIVSRAEAQGRRHRVILGPYAQGPARDLKNRLPGARGKAAWLAMACPDALPRGAKGTCMDLKTTWR